MRDIYYVYEICYPNGIPFYVGKGKGDRINNHFKKSDIYNIFKTRIINKIIDSGKQPLLKKIAENLSEYVAFEIEKFLIAYYGRRNNKTGILSNMTDGGEGSSGYKHTNESKIKISKRSRGCNNPFYGKKFSEEHKRKLSVSHKGKNVGKDHPMYGKRHSIETRVKISDAARNISSETREKMSEAKKGIPRPIETRKKISEAFRGNKHPACKQIKQYTKDDIFIKMFSYIKQASELLDINAGNISACCRGERKSAGGFIWRYSK